MSFNWTHIAEKKTWKFVDSNCNYQLIPCWFFVFIDLQRGHLSYFLTQLEKLLIKLYKPLVPIILCGDFNINFADSSYRAFELESLLCSFSLQGIIKFPTRITPSTQSKIDNIFLDKKIFQAQVYPVINGISNRDGQLAIKWLYLYSIKINFFIQKSNGQFFYT